MHGLQHSFHLTVGGPRCLPTLADAHMGSLSGPDSHLQEVGRELSPVTSSKPRSGLSVLRSWGPAPSHPPARVCPRHSSEGTQGRLAGGSALACDIPSFCYLDFLFHLESRLPLKARKATQSFTTNKVLAGWRPGSKAPFVMCLIFLQFRLQMNLKGEGPPGIEISHLYFACFIPIAWLLFFFTWLWISFMVQTDWPTNRNRKPKGSYWNSWIRLPILFTTFTSDSTTLLTFISTPPSFLPFACFPSLTSNCLCILTKYLTLLECKLIMARSLGSPTVQYLVPQ